MNDLYIAGGDTLPARLRDLCRYVLWRREPRSARNGKPVKPAKAPYQIDGDTNAKTNDPTTWATFDDAQRALASPGLAGREFGIGLVLGDGLSGIDLDGVRNAETGEVLPWALDVCEWLRGSYIEISPSGTGLHILFEEAAGGAACNLRDETSGEAFEYYAGYRFFTVTGVPYELAAADVYPVTPEVRAAICTDMHLRFGKEEKAVSAQHRGHDGSPIRDDADVLRIAFAAKNGEAMERLYFGVGPTVGDGSESDGDWALAKMLAFYTGRNREQIERLMRASGRYRSKWHDPRGDSTLLARTIEKACNVTEETYGMGWNGSGNGRASHSNGAAEKSGDAGTNGAIPSARPSRTTEFMSVGQLLSEPEDEQSYLVEGMLGAGSIAFVSAKPKFGKTTWLLFLTLCVVRGERFFGRRAKQGAVLYVALEGNKKEWQRVAKAMGFVDDDKFFIYVGQAPRDAITWLRESAAKHKPALIIVDTLQRFARLKDICNYSEVTNATEPLVEIARDSDAVLLCAVHAKKQNTGGDDGDAVLGSTGLFGAVDTLIALKKTANGSRVMSTEQRYGDNMPETVLALDPETKRLSQSGERADVDRMVIERDMLAAVAESPGLEREELLAEAGGRTETAKAALKALLKDGRMSRSGRGVRGEPHQYWPEPLSMQAWSHARPVVAGLAKWPARKRILIANRNGNKKGQTLMLYRFILVP